MAEATPSTDAPETAGGTATESEDLQYEIKIEDAGPARKRLTITVPPEEVGGKIEDSFATLAGEATLPGFRPGKAPRRLIERRFGSSVRTETRNQLIAEVYAKAIEDHGIEAVGEPDGDQLKDLEIEAGKPFTFTVEIEVAPEFELPDFSKIELKRPLVEVTDQHLEEELARQRAQFGRPNELEGKFEPGDRLRGRAIITDVGEDNVLEELPDAVVGLPSDPEEPKGHILGLHVEDLTTLFKGKKIGDTVSYEADVPDSDERPMIRGKRIRIDFTIDGGVRIAPASLEEVVEAYGLESEESLQSETRSSLEQRAEREQRSAMHEQVCEQLVDMIDLELPEKLSAAQAGRALDRQRVEMMYRGLSVDEVESRIAEIRAESEESARTRLKLFFILSRLAKTFKIEVDDREVNGRIARIAMQHGERPEKIRTQFVQDGRLQQIALQIQEHKAMDRVIDQAKITDITAEEWNAMVDARRSSDTPSPKKSAAGKKKKKKTTSKKPAD